MRERDFAERLGIPPVNWPTRLPEGSLREIVESSQTKPLRLVIARFIGGEAMSLWNDLKPKNYEVLAIQEGRSVTDLAINEGYGRVHTIIIRANSFLEDRQGEQDRQVKAVRFRQERERRQLRETLREDMKQAVSDLRSDPTGVSHLNRHLKRIEAVWGENDASMNGLVEGVRRYKYLYGLAVAGGAVADKSENGIRNLLEKLKNKRS